MRRRAWSRRSGRIRTGAAHVIATDHDDLAGRVKDITGGEGARIVFDSIGGPGLTRLAQLVPRDGTLIVYGRHR
ncbi:zinc-binding dehydrogenase [Streptomyces mirabilis]|uniref:zinc-binding dehydrogenase n=1 Tax=Streptomyces mirabilis TaxID=68239 RepID=UPI0033298DB1